MNAFRGDKVVQAQQATAVPYRQKNGCLQFCLISASSGRWIFPKGIINGKQDFLTTARLEAIEEAGLHGEIDPNPLGVYQIQKRGKRFNVVAVLLSVRQVDKEWEESDWRERTWVSLEAGLNALEDDSLKKLLLAAAGRIAEFGR